MTSEDIESHVDDIINAIDEDSKDKVSREELIDEINKFMEYGVPIEQAKQTLVKKFGGNAPISMPSSNERTLITDLEPNLRNVNLLGRIIAINPKEITVKGENRTIFYGILGDESGTIPFTSWTSIEFEKGDVVEINNAYTREWQGAVQLNFGDRVIINKTDKDKLPKAAFEPRTFKVNDLRSGIGSVEITAKIVEINERDADISGEKKKVFSGIIADETGKAQFTSWHDFNLKQGDVFNISGGYVKSWKGIPQLTFDERSTVKKLDKSKIPKGELEVQKMPMHQLVEKRGALDVLVEGTVIDIRPGSGVIHRCPDCNRALQNGECSIHGKVKGTKDLRIKIVVDDGTGAVSSIINKELTEKLLNKKFDEISKMDEETVFEEINKKLFAKKISLKGNALGDEFGTSIIAKNVEKIDMDIGTEAEKLLSELEDLL